MVQDEQDLFVEHSEQQEKILLILNILSILSDWSMGRAFRFGLTYRLKSQSYPNSGFYLTDSGTSH